MDYQAAKARKELQDNKTSLQYESDYEDIKKYVKINNNNDVTPVTPNFENFKIVFEHLLKTINNNRKNLKTKLSNYKIQQDNGDATFSVVGDVLKKENNYIYVSHRLDVICNKTTLLDEINYMKESEDTKKKLSNALHDAFSNVEHPDDMHNIDGTDNNVVKYFKLTKQIETNNTRWKNIPNNTGGNNIYTYRTPEMKTTSEHEIIQNYLTTCDKYQEEYIKSHNFVIKLFNYLIYILKNIKKIIDIIENLSRIKPVNKKSGAAAIIFNIPKDIIQKDDLEVIQKILYNKTQGGGFFNNSLNMYGGAAVAPAVVQVVAPAIVPDVDKYNLDTTDNIYNQYTLKIPTEDMDEYEPYVPKITIKITDKDYIFIVDKQLVNTLTLTLTLTKTYEKINTGSFNGLSIDQQRAAINIFKIGIKDKHAASVIKSIASFIVSSTQNVYNANLETMKYTNTKKNHSGDVEKPIPLIAVNKPRIDNILLKCYDLQVLYLIKYFEIIVLYKYIIYFLNIFTDYVCVAKFIISLFGLIEIDVETVPDEITITKIITDVNEMVNSHDTLLTGITMDVPESTTSQEGVALQTGGNNEAAVAIISNQGKIDIICDKIYKHKNETANETDNIIHNLYEQLYNETNNDIKKELNLKHGEAPLDKTIVSKSELYYNYSKLYNKFVIPFIRKQFNTHNTHKIVKNIEKDNKILLLKLTAITNYFAKFDCYNTSCLKKSVFSPDDIPQFTENGKNIITILDVLAQPPFYFTFNNDKYNDPNAKFIFYHVLYNAANAGITDKKKPFDVNYNNMKKYVETYFTQTLQNIQQGRTGGITVPVEAPVANADNFLNIKQHILGIIENAEKAAVKEAAKAVEEAAEVKAAAAKEAAVKKEADRLAADKAVAAAAEKAAAVQAAEIQAAAQRAAADKAAAEKAAAAAKAAAEKAAAKAEEDRVAALVVKTPKSEIAKYIKICSEQENMNLIQALAFSKNKLYNETDNTYDDENLTKILAYDDLKYNKNIPQQQIKIDEIKKLFDDASYIISNINTFNNMTEMNVEHITIEGDKIYTSIIQFSTKEGNLLQIINHLKTKISFIYEMIGGAAKVFVRIKPYESTAAQAAGGTRTSEQTIQDGGYKYDDIIKIDREDKFTINISDKCNTLLAKDDKKYGPFAGIFTPNYNNVNVYEHLFGVNSIQQYITNPNTSNIPKAPEDKANSYYANVKNIPYDLTKTLSEGRNVVLFGYGFSGSGKTYTLVEGSENDTSLLEQFIEKNANYITSVEFLELYPLGHGKTGKIKIICGEKKNKDDNSDDNIHGDKDTNHEEKQFYNTINKTNGTNITFNEIIAQIVNINAERRTRLRILATPNNDDSSRSYLQITIKLTIQDNTTSKLVFFDMPGSENTVRIKQEFLGVETFNTIIKTTEQSDINILHKFSEIQTSYGPIILEDFTHMQTDSNNGKKYGIYINKDYYLKYDGRSTTVISPVLTKNFIYFTMLDNSNLNLTIFTKMFKELIIKTVRYGNKASYSTAFTMTEQDIASSAEHLTLFFNKQTCKSILDVPNNSTIFFLDDTDIKNIVTYFLNTVIFQPIDMTIKEKEQKAEAEADAKAKANAKQTQQAQKKQYSPLLKKTDTLYFKYFKLTRLADTVSNEVPTDKDNINMKISDLNYNQITKIYNIQIMRKAIPLYYNASILKILLNLDLPQGFYKFEHLTNQPQNLMILLFMYLLGHSMYHCKTPTQKTDEHNSNEYMYRILIIYVYKYVKFIIDQGSAIVTTLEHLKYFFLSNINKIDEYNTNNTEQAMILYDSNDTTQKTSILTTDRIYTTPTTLTFTNKEQIQKTITLNERVNFGNMSDYKLLSILQKLSNASTKLGDYINETTSTFNLQKNTANPVQDTNKSQALFIMLAHIKCFSGDSNNKLNEKDINDQQLDNTLQKICTAEYDTLEFAQSISSTSQGAPIVAAQFAFVGGSITNSNSQHKTKKNIKKFDFNTLYKTQNKDNKHKSFTIKKKYNNVNQSIFKIKSKKQ